MKTFKLAAFLIVWILLASRVGAQSFLTNGLVAHYLLDGNATDASGHGNHGVIHGPTPAGNRYGVPNGCFRFNGQTQYIAALADKLPTTNRTVSLWFYLIQYGNRPVLFGYGGGACGTSFFFGINFGAHGAFELTTHCNTFNMQVGYWQSPPIGAWHQWVVSADDSTVKFYLDGFFLGARPGTLTTTVAGTELSLGTAPSPTGQVPYKDSIVGCLDGYLDDVRVYDRTLSDAEIKMLWRLESRPALQIQKQSGLVHLDMVPLRNGTLYQLQYSHDLINWTNRGLAFYGNVSAQAQDLEIADDADTFWRLEVLD